MADPSTFKPILPPLPATFSQSFSVVKDVPARGDHFPHIFWCKLPKLRKIIWFFFQKPIIRATPIIKLLRILSITTKTFVAKHRPREYSKYSLLPAGAKILTGKEVCTLYKTKCFIADKVAVATLEATRDLEIDCGSLFTF
jgi:hypothetical protein